MNLIKRINLLLAVLSCLVLVWAFFVCMAASDILEESFEKISALTIDLEGSESKNDFYEALADRILDLNISTLAMPLPDLKQVLVFFGKNERPDVNPDESVYFLGVKGNDEAFGFKMGECFFLLYDDSMNEEKRSRGHFVASPGNEPTSLWVEIQGMLGEKLRLEVHMRGPNDEVLGGGDNAAQLSLPSVDYLRLKGGENPWMLDGNRVDAGFLARQKARWYGKDLFLGLHGGSEYHGLETKQRIDFVSDEDSYFCYVGEGGILVWTGIRWEAVEPGEASRGLPLLHLKQLDERLIRWEIWSPEGKAHLRIHLAKSVDAWSPSRLEQDFRFVGFRTRRQAIIEISGERVSLNPSEWLIKTEKDGWLTITNEEEIDQYVEGHLRGELFILEGVSKETGQHVLHARVFNSTRTDFRDITLGLKQSQEILSQKGGIMKYKEDPSIMRERRQLDMTRAPEHVLKKIIEAGSESSTAHESVGRVPLGRR